MSVAPTHQGADRMQKKKKRKKGKGEEGKRQGSGDKERIRRGFKGKEGKGGRKEERGRRKHMDLFKNTAIYQSQAHSESRCFKNKKKKG